MLIVVPDSLWRYDGHQLGHAPGILHGAVPGGLVYNHCLPAVKEQPPGECTRLPQKQDTRHHAI